MTDRLKYFLLVSVVYGSIAVTLMALSSMLSLPVQAQSLTSQQGYQGHQGVSGLAAAICDKRQEITKSLTQDYREDPVSMGVANGGSVIEVFASKQGTWTMILSKPNGISCMIAAGQSWESLPKLMAGHKI